MTKRPTIENAAHSLGKAKEVKIQKAMPDFMRLGEDDHWRSLRANFKESKEALHAIRLEAEAEGKERALREGRNAATRRDLEDSDVIRFQGFEMEDIAEFVESARDCIPSLERMFESKHASSEFLTTWGAFQLSYGFVMAAYFRTGDALDQVRNSAKGGETRRLEADLKRRFVACLMKARLDSGTAGKNIYAEVAAQIHEFTLAGVFPSGFPKEWFESLLDLRGYSQNSKNYYPKLKATFDDRHLSRREIARLAALPRDDLPSI